MMAVQAERDMAAGQPPRYLALLTEYDGSGFHGWQAQTNGRTVQQVLLKALMELTGENDLRLNGCSRTDAGVHARGHVSHFESRTKIPAERLPLALNSILPDDMVVLDACEVSPDFNARYHARAKIYSYQIWRHRCRPVILRQQSCHVAGPLDFNLIRQAMPYLLGQHDFRAFMDAGSGDKNPVRTIQALSLKTRGPLLILNVQGDGFIYHMVRILAGTLLAVGQGKIQPQELSAVIESKDRKLAGKTMPPQGLCLERVLYDPPLFDEYFRKNREEGEDDVQFSLE